MEESEDAMGEDGTWEVTLGIIYPGDFSMEKIE